MLKSTIISVFICMYLKRVPATGQWMEPAELLQQGQEKWNFNSAIKLESDSHMQVTTAIHTLRGLWTGPGAFKWASQHRSECLPVSAQRLFTELHPICLGGRGSFAEVIWSPSFNSASTRTIPLISYSSSVRNTCSPLPNKRCLGHHASWLKKNSKAGLLLEKVLPLNTKEHYRR